MKKSGFYWMQTGLIIMIAVVIAILVYNTRTGFQTPDGILNYNDTLQKRTRIWGDLADDAVGIIKRMTEPDIGFYPSKMKLMDYADVIV